MMWWIYLSSYVHVYVKSCMKKKMHNYIISIEMVAWGNTKETIISQRPPHPLHRVSLLIRHKKKIEPLFPHLSEYLYNAWPCIQGAHPERNHPYNNYSLLRMSKKGSLFTSANVAPRDQLNTQLEIWYMIRSNGDHFFLRREDCVKFSYA